MSNLNRLVLTSVFALSLLSSVGCGRRLPTPEPTASASGEPSAAPTDAPPPPQPPPPGPAPTTQPPPPGPPPPNPPPPGPDNPPPPPDQPPPPPSNPAVEKFWAQLGAAGFTDKAAVTGELVKTLGLKVTGWSKGKLETPDQNVEQMFTITKGLFAKPPADPAEYAARSMAFAQLPVDGCTLFVDLKASTEHKNLFVLKHDPTSKQILGFNEKDLAYDPGISAMTAVRRFDGAEGKIFFYGEENGKFLDPARFVAVPPDVLKPQQQVQAMAYRAPLYQARSVVPYPYRR
ncbi:MAG TPA: hypothetical protein V6D23_25845 [Candidatus Obscuribacterales bacterium]